MDASIITNIVLSALSFILAAVSVVTVVITLKQNNRMIESSTRPYIVVYGYVTNFGSLQYTIAIKNFGNSAARIEEFSPSIDLDKIAINPNENRTPFNNIVGTLIPPNFSITRDVAWNGHPEKIDFKIRYISNGKQYEDTFSLQYNIELNDSHGKVSSGDPLKNISYTVQEYVKRNI